MGRLEPSRAYFTVCRCTAPARRAPSIRPFVVQPTSCDKLISVETISIVGTSMFRRSAHNVLVAGPLSTLAHTSPGGAALTDENRPPLPCGRCRREFPGTCSNWEPVGPPLRWSRADGHASLTASGVAVDDDEFFRGRP